MSQSEPTFEQQLYHVASVDVRCEIRAVDLDSRRFSARLADGRTVEGTFPETLELEFVMALGNMVHQRLRVLGEGLYSGESVRLESILSAREIHWEPLHRSSTESKSLLQIVKEIHESVPAEEWEKIPRDAARNLDHYLYGGEREEE